jgi:hypothetical protein
MFESVPQGDAILLKVCMCVVSVAIIQQKRKYEMTDKIKLEKISSRIRIAKEPRDLSHYII